MAARHLGVLAFGALIASGGIMTALFAQTPSKTYQFLGSWAVSANQGQGSKELHLVYASPGTVAAYNKNGRFPDGTVLVKEAMPIP
jgi:hypothetical protein